MGARSKISNQRSPFISWTWTAWKKLWLWLEIGSFNACKWLSRVKIHYSRLLFKIYQNIEKIVKIITTITYELSWWQRFSCTYFFCYVLKKIYFVDYSMLILWKFWFFWSLFFIEVLRLWICFVLFSFFGINFIFWNLRAMIK